MKKLITILAVTIAIPALVKAQGTVNFSSTSANHVIQITPGVAASPGSFTVGLYYGVVGSTFNQLQLIGPAIQNGVGGGISGGVRTTGIDVPGGQNAFFQVRAWAGSFASYEEAIANGVGAVGFSPIFTNSTGNPTGTPPTPPANLTGWTSPIVIVPEPSTIVLGMVGAASLLFIRRRN